MKKKLPIIIGTIVLLVLLVIGGVFLFKNNKEKADKEKDEVVNNIPKIVLDEKNIPKFIDGSVVYQKVKTEEDVFKALNEVRDMYGFEDAKKEFKVLNTDTSLDFTYYRLQQIHNGYPVYGNQVVVSVDKDNKVSSLSGNYTADIGYSYFSLSETKAKEAVAALMKTDYEIFKTEKYIYLKDDKAIASYVFTMADDSDYYQLVISAKDGTVVDKISLLNEEQYSYTGAGADGTEYTITLDQDGNEYKFHDPVRKITIGDGTKANLGDKGVLDVVRVLFTDIKPISATMADGKLTSTSAASLPNAISTMYTFQKTYDYYKNVLGRDSYDNKGSEILVSIDAYAKVNGEKKEWQNAAWLNGFRRMYIGTVNGITFSQAVDVTAHEFTHGVIEYTAGLTGKGEPGALNEGYADIIGNLVEGKNFQVGESIKEGRDMANPHAHENPSEKGGKYYFPTDEEQYDEEWKEKANKALGDWKDWDKGGAHNNSTVVSHAAYLMYENGAFESKEEMAKVWYNSLFLLTPSSDFEDCALAVLQAAQILGLNDEKVKIIESAFVETKMLELKTSTISGKVTDASTDEPISGTIVTASRTGNVHVQYETTTNKDGEYTFNDLPVGDYIIQFEKEKYFTSETEATLPESGIQNLDAKLEAIPEVDSEKSEVVFVMDISLSMDTSDPTDIRKQIISNVLGLLNDNSKVALVTFTKEAKVINDGLSDQSVDRKVLITDIFNIVNDDGSSSNSGTNGKAGIAEALSLFSEEENVRRYIVFFTDGQDNDWSGTSYSDETNLKRIAKDTNGKYYRATNSIKLYQFSQRIYKEIK